MGKILILTSSRLEGLMNKEKLEIYKELENKGKACIIYIDKLTNTSLTEKINYLYLAPSKLRSCSIGPELITDMEFNTIKIRCIVLECFIKITSCYVIYCWSNSHWGY